ncbi:MAG: sigma-70 family RNA polymerase sigma factor [Acetobacteraceae bacterium]
MNPSRPEQAYPSRAPTAAPSDDVATISRIASGDEAALATLYDRWAQTVYSLVFQLLRDADAAEDVVEETFWQVWHRATSYDISRGTVRTWILTIGRSRALDRLRSRKRNREDVSDDLSLSLVRDPRSDPSQMAEGAERRQLVYSALSELPDEQRGALELAYFRGLSQSEIAQLLGEPLGTVKTRMRLGMQKLRDKLIGLREVRA